MFQRFWEPRLLRSASLMALVILCLSLLVMGVLLPRLFYQKAIEVGEGYAAQIAQNLSEIMFREFVPLHWVTKADGIVREEKFVTTAYMLN